MSRLARASAVVASAFLAVPLWGVPTAAADETVLVPASAGYFNADGIRKPDESPAAPPNVTSDRADGVAPGHLAVAARAGSENKASFLLFDLFDLGLDVSISKAVLTVPVAPDSPDGNINIAPAPEKVVACPAGEGGFIGDDGTAIQDAPARACDKSMVKATATADGSAYAFDITPIAQGWVIENDGVALTSEPTARATAFQRVFKPADQVKLALTFTAADAEEFDIELPVAPALTGGTGTASTDFGSSFDSSFSSPDTGLGAVSEVPLSAEAPALPEEAAAPAGPELAAGPATVPVSAMTAAPLAPSAAFWVGLLLVGALLALLSLIMGDARVPQASARQTRLTQALQARERSGRGRAPRAVLGV